ncbi:MAG TPA: N-methyl-L-tryptophan oxidase [Streptosporangiaceae bacterium]|nr:N-methyl-L-tryptophan oxidase [Streptosporangiaceae bacterium]
MTDIDIAVIGLGLAGSAAAWALTARGRSVTAFEAFSPGHRRGSSHGHSRIFRHAYADPFYVELTRRARELWRRLEDASGERLVTPTGGIDYGEASHLTQMAEVLAAAGVPTELLEPAAARERWPGLAFDGPVLFQPDAGVIDPEKAIAAMTKLASGAGARLSYENPVTALERDGDGGVRLHTAGESWRARMVVVAAGGWTAPLLAGLVELPPLRVTQEQAFFFRPAEAGPWPTFIHDARAVYGLPEGPLVKVAEHHRGKETTADARDGVVDPAGRRRLIAYVRERLPGLQPVPEAELTCLYTVTENQDFVIDRRGRIVVCSACSGHGAKFAPLTGELVADLVDGRPPLPRFALPA